MLFIYFYFQVVHPAPEEFDGAVVEGQQFVVTASGGNEHNSARVTIERASTGHLFTRGLDMISKGNRFVRSEGEYVAQAVDVDRGYLKTSVGERASVIKICCGPADWVPSLQVVKLGCCDVGYVAPFPHCIIVTLWPGTTACRFWPKPYELCPSPPSI